MSTFGSNVGFVDELYARFREDPGSVSEPWREFFADYRPQVAVPVQQAGDGSGDGDGLAAAVETPALVARPAPAAQAPAPAPKPAPTKALSPDEAARLVPLTGVSAKIAENMEASLAVPTATSVRNIPVKLLEENRRAINLHQESVAGAKVSFTYLIAWAVVRALEKHPGMNAGYVEHGGKPHRLPRPVINLGLAIDTERKGERILLVPSIKDVGKKTFTEFVAAYDDVIVRARNNKLLPPDFEGTTVSITNPGMIGTALSVPRLMQGQAAIIGVGRIGLPAEYAGVAAEVVSELGLSKVMTITSTYDHRVIQGAESGAVLDTLEKLLLGHDDFYLRIFRELGVPHEPVLWSADQNPPAFSGGGNHEVIRKQAMVLQLIRAHRVRGRLTADIDPLLHDPTLHAPELDLATYGLSVWDLDRHFIGGGLAGSRGTLPLREIVETLRQTYCSHIGVEFMHIPETEPRDWLQELMERTRNAEPVGKELQGRLLSKLNAAEAFERFLHTTYVGHKRFSLEGGETLIPMLDTLLNDAAAEGVTAAVVGMAHRGRLNVLANVLGKGYGVIFREFEGDIDPQSMQGSGDVKYHLGAKGTHVTPDGKKVELTLAANPSHLEAVDPVVEGMARALQERNRDRDRRQVLPILVHGDAAFAGQGVVAETLNLSNLDGYRTGGTVHIVVNNQIGFTTGAKDARSSLYATDVAKGVRAPIFHVNGDYPEDAVRALRLAFAFRQRFKRDAVVDVVCYRRWGHNEGDDPSYTNPVMYAAIEKHRSVRKLYTEQLLRRGDIDMKAAEQSLGEFQSMLKKAHEDVKKALSGVVPQPARDREDVEGAARPAGITTSLERPVIDEILDGLERLPTGFEIHPKLGKQLARRRPRLAEGKIDWGLAEALAFGSLVLQGVPVRLSGQDSGRGTFSHRHAKLYDHVRGTGYVPLANLRPGQAPFWVFDSHLSEFGVLGFEYGFSVNFPEALVLWEAQFGDFGNGAQIIVDQFIDAAEEKWSQRSNLTMLLPHGYEGQGPEHSSARIERYLQLCARGNWRVCYPSTPASYFHLLRRQALSPEKKPLVVFTPKSLLRLPECVSTAADFTEGSFAEVLEDELVTADRVRRVVLTSGKVFYDLDAYRREKGVDDVAVIRLEQYYPYPSEHLGRLLQKKYGTVHDIVWLQEEPRNMGAWDFLDELVRKVLAPGQTLRYIGRPPSSSPATGSAKRHAAEQAALAAEAFETPSVAHSLAVAVERAPAAL
jgi:2-oxoglutarate dehydrogenase E1 component